MAQTYSDRDEALKVAVSWATDDRWIICLGKAGRNWLIYAYQIEYPKDVEHGTIRYVLPGGVITKLS